MKPSLKSASIGMLKVSLEGLYRDLSIPYLTTYNERILDSAIHKIKKELYHRGVYVIEKVKVSYKKVERGIR